MTEEETEQFKNLSLKCKVQEGIIAKLNRRIEALEIQVKNLQTYIRKELTK